MSTSKVRVINLILIEYEERYEQSVYYKNTQKEVFESIQKSNTINFF